MPTLWRYLLGHFLKINLFCILAFVAILLTMRLDEIAHFAALGAPLSYILLFTFYQIPYILPIAIPISCLIASLLVVQRLSSTHELTALRACGFSLKDILAPILITAAFLSIGNFWIVSEVATQTHLTTNILKSELRSINPLLLLNNKHLMRLKGIYFDSFGTSRVGESAGDVILALPNKNQQRLNLLIARNLRASPNLFMGQGITLLTSLDSKQEGGFDHLLLENMEESITSTDDFSQFLQKKVLTINNDYLKISLLLVHIKDQRAKLAKAKTSGLEVHEIKQLKSAINRSISDITRRFSIASAVFSFTLMGAAFGINISRRKKNYTLYFAIFLTVFYLVSFFVAKGVEQNPLLAAALYLIPHFILILASIVVLNRVSRGRE